MIRSLVILLGTVLIRAEDEAVELKTLLKDLSSYVEGRESSFDFDTMEDISELRKIIEDHGFSSDKLLSDIAFLKGIPGIFKNGDGTRWTTLNFAYQLACYQGKRGIYLTKALWAMSKYNGYGCYCGGGVYHGNYLDATDKCCQTHDYCYDRVQAKYKLTLGCHTYTVSYGVSCCEDQKHTKCTDSGPSAGRELCECDQAMSKCVARHAGSYNKNFLENRSQCRGGSTTKPLTAWEVLKSCKHVFKPIVTFPKSYGSQGTCPKKNRGFWWGRK